MADHEFHSKFLSRNDKIKEIKLGLEGKIDVIRNKQYENAFLSLTEKRGRTITACNGNAYIVKPDGHVLCLAEYIDDKDENLAEGWSGICGIATMRDFLIGLKKDGTIILKKYINRHRRRMNILDKMYQRRVESRVERTLRKWTDIIAIDAGPCSIVGIKKDGNLAVCTYYKKKEMKEISQWKGITKIICTDMAVYGLAQNGTILINGYDNYERQEICSWVGVVDIAADWYNPYALKMDGTVMTSSYGNDVSSWTGIVRVAAGKRGHIVVGLKQDGSVLAAGQDANEYERRFGRWNHLTDIAFADEEMLVGIREDGTVLIMGLDPEPGNVFD